jgi:hypothetical protein
MAIASGYHDTVVVVGAEAMTHTTNDITTKALATASHWPTEGGEGETFVSLNGALMQMYMEKYNVPHSAFAAFPLTAHTNAALNEEAVFHSKPLDYDAFEAAKSIWGPVQLFDACPTCDGAAAVVLTADRETARQADGSVVRVAGSGSACDLLPVQQRKEPLNLQAVEDSMVLMFGRDLRSRMPLVSTPACLKFVLVCEQWHSSPVVALLPADPVNVFQTLKAQTWPWRTHRWKEATLTSLSYMMLTRSWHVCRSSLPGLQSVVLPQNSLPMEGLPWTEYYQSQLSAD